ncbi:MAG: hypothetical protein M1832_004514 [Thelocarpon impressellum]|nr:MAG: hypothetical protein M1832_004514 [Thelocarpon impressellum]
MTSQRASTAWTAQEDQTLLAARAQGKNWAPIQNTHFPSKTPNACRKRHERLMERRNTEDWDGEKLEKLAKEYLNMRRDMWTMLASRVGEKWQVVESKVSEDEMERRATVLKTTACMEKGLKNIQSAGRSASRRERTASGNDDSGLGGYDPDVEGADDGSEVRDTPSRSDGGSAAPPAPPASPPTTQPPLRFGGDLSAIVHATSQPIRMRRS